MFPKANFSDHRKGCRFSHVLLRPPVSPPVFLPKRKLLPGYATANAPKSTSPKVNSSASNGPTPLWAADGMEDNRGAAVTLCNFRRSSATRQDLVIPRRLCAPGFGMAEVFRNRPEMETRAKFLAGNIPIPLAFSVVKTNWARARRATSRSPQESTEIGRRRSSDFR